MTMTPFDEAVTAVIRELVGRSGLSNNAVARQAGLDRGNFSRKFRGMSPWRAAEVRVLGDALGVPGSLLFAMAEGRVVR